MAGRVDDVELHALVAHRRVLGEDRDALLALEIHRVHHAVIDVLVRAKRAGLPEHGVNQRGLAVVDVRDDRDVSEVFSDRPWAASSVRTPPIFGCYDTAWMTTGPRLRSSSVAWVGPSTSIAFGSWFGRHLAARIRRRIGRAAAELVALRRVGERARAVLAEAVLAVQDHVPRPARAGRPERRLGHEDRDRLRDLARLHADRALAGEAGVDEARRLEAAHLDRARPRVDGVVAAREERRGAGLGVAGIAREDRQQLRAERVAERRREVAQRRAQVDRVAAVDHLEARDVERAGVEVAGRRVLERARAVVVARRVARVEDRRADDLLGGDVALVVRGGVRGRRRGGDRRSCRTWSGRSRRTRRCCRGRRRRSLVARRCRCWWRRPRPARARRRCPVTWVVGAVTVEPSAGALTVSAALAGRASCSGP